MAVVCDQVTHATVTYHVKLECTYFEKKNEKLKGRKIEQKKKKNTFERLCGYIYSKRNQKNINYSFKMITRWYKKQMPVFKKILFSFDQ